MIITKKALTYVFEITKYLYFNLELNQEIELKKLRSPENDAMFASALDYIIDRNLTLLGGFQIRYLDQERTKIKKVPHFRAIPVEGWTDEKHLLPFKFEGGKTKSKTFLPEKYEQLFEYGNT